MIAYALNHPTSSRLPQLRELADKPSPGRHTTVVSFTDRVSRDLNRQREPDDPEALLEFLNVATIVLNEHLVIRRMRGSAALWLGRFFPARTNLSRLPAALEIWAQTELARPGGSRPECRFVANDRQLGVTLVAAPSPEVHHLLILRERPRPDSPKHLEQFGLSPRETEVLSWLVQGKSNPEIGRILGIAARTVHKHLEHIYAHLGVENRTTATALVLDPA